MRYYLPPPPKGFLYTEKAFAPDILTLYEAANFLEAALFFYYLEK